MRTPTGGFTFPFGDHQGTALTAVSPATGQAITRRKQLPFGTDRTDTRAAFPGTRGFVGGSNDPTGLTHRSARARDPTLGRFLSVDPVIDFDDPAQMNACSYAHNNPVTQSNPDGLCPNGPATYNDEWLRSFLSFQRSTSLDHGIVTLRTGWRVDLPSRIETASRDI
ncbi:RHS repeat-associated core domain-containing protein [Streptomyces sp. NPDC026673]|uniref:RHS repeat-associated core domain-containing protein n=1 Tax=Streptomyces sp. NPDC026673 TaxID=3155724 RepID=UPI0033C729F8